MWKHLPQTHCSTARLKMHSPLLSAAGQSSDQACVNANVYDKTGRAYMSANLSHSCSNAHCRMLSPLLSAAVPNRLTVGTIISVNICSSDILTDSPQCTTALLRANACPTECCWVEQANSMLVTYQLHPLNICSSHRCANDYDQCNTAQGHMRTAAALRIVSLFSRLAKQLATTFNVQWIANMLWTPASQGGIAVLPCTPLTSILGS